jgi:hypothetical protein
MIKGQEQEVPASTSPVSLGDKNLRKQVSSIKYNTARLERQGVGLPRLKREEDGYWMAKRPSLPGHSRQGETKEKRRALKKHAEKSYAALAARFMGFIQPG